MKHIKVSAILSDMTVNTRQFLRDFSFYREKAEAGETITIEARGGSRFIFARTGKSPRPQQAPEPLPKSVTDRWDFESAALPAADWEMNR